MECGCWVACHQSQCRQNFNAPLVNTAAMALQYLPEVQPQHLAPPFPVWKHMRRNTYRKKKRQKQSTFIYGTTKRIWPRFSARPDLERSLAKTKKNYSSHPVSSNCSFQVEYLTNVRDSLNLNGGDVGANLPLGYRIYVGIV